MVNLQQLYAVRVNTLKDIMILDNLIKGYTAQKREKVQKLNHIDKLIKEEKWQKRKK